MVAEMFVNHMGPNATTQRRVVLVDETLCEWRPRVLDLPVTHLPILPEASPECGTQPAFRGRTSKGTWRSSSRTQPVQQPDRAHDVYAAAPNPFGELAVG